MTLRNKIEALIYISGDQGITIKKLKELTNASSAAIRENIVNLTLNYEKSDSALCIIQNGDIVQMMAKTEFDALIQKYTKSNDSLLTQSALETLTIVAYKQPVTRIEVDEVRGINSSVSLRNLLSFGLIKIKGKTDDPGNPSLYATTDLFLKAFGLKNISELPILSEDDETVSENNNAMFDN